MAARSQGETTTKLVRHGDATALPLSREVLRAAGMEGGDEVVVTTDRANGTLTVRKADTAYARAMAAGERFMDRYRRTFERLAK